MIQRVLIVGMGSIGKRHLRIARELLPKADIRVLRHELTTHIAEGANGVFFRVDEAIAFRPEIAVLANPAPFHIDVAILLAEIGTHLLIEKPLSINENGVEELNNIALRSGSKVLVGYNLRYLHSLQHFKKLISEGKCGRVLSVHSVVGQELQSWRPEADYRRGVSARSDLGGGVLLELSHELDYLRWVFGDVNWTMAVLRKQSKLEIDVEDSALMIFEFKSINAETPIIANVSLDFVRQEPTRICTVVGEEGTLRWDGLSGSIEHYSAVQKQFIQIYKSTQQAAESYVEEWKDFLFCINDKTGRFKSLNDGLAVLNIIEAVRESSLTGLRTEVNYSKLNENSQ